MCWCEELEVGEGCNCLRVRWGGKVEGGWDGMGWIRCMRRGLLKG